MPGGRSASQWYYCIREECGAGGPWTAFCLVGSTFQAGTPPPTKTRSQSVGSLYVVAARTFLHICPVIYLVHFFVPISHTRLSGLFLAASAGPPAAATDSVWIACVAKGPAENGDFESCHREESSPHSRPRSDTKKIDSQSRRRQYLTVRWLSPVDCPSVQVIVIRSMIVLRGVFFRGVVVVGCLLYDRKKLDYSSIFCFPSVPSRPPRTARGRPHSPALDLLHALTRPR